MKKIRLSNSSLQRQLFLEIHPESVEVVLMMGEHEELRKSYDVDIKSLLMLAEWYEKMPVGSHSDYDDLRLESYGLNFHGYQWQTGQAFFTITWVHNPNDEQTLEGYEYMPYHTLKIAEALRDTMKQNIESVGLSNPNDDGKIYLDLSTGTVDVVFTKHDKEVKRKTYPAYLHDLRAFARWFSEMDHSQGDRTMPDLHLRSLDLVLKNYFWQWGEGTFRVVWSPEGGEKFEVGGYEQVTASNQRIPNAIAKVYGTI